MDASRREFLKGAAAITATSALNPGLPEHDEGNSALLWYRSPAKHWMESLPIGNGRLGATVFGGVDRELIHLNEDTLWSGPSDEQWNNPHAYDHLAEVRRLLMDDRDYAAADRVTRLMQGPYNQSYLPLCDLNISFPPTGNFSQYRRELDLDTGILTVSYTADGARYIREIFCSFPAQLVVLRLTCDQPRRLSCTASLSSLLRTNFAGSEGDDFVLRGKAPRHVDPNYLTKSLDPVIYDDALGKGMYFEVRVRGLPDQGNLSFPEGSMVIRGATSATLLISAATGYKQFGAIPDGSPEEIADSNTLYVNKASKSSYPQLRAEHIQDHQSLFRRVSLSLGEAITPRTSTGERLRQLATRDEPQFAALYFQFARYLMIASSRPGTQPANLQGIWNNKVRPPWSSNWTLNINAQMNYWLAEVGNLSELHKPLFDLTDHLSVTGRETARVYYGLDGWTAHHNADLWAEAAPVGNQTGDPVWANWPMGGAWLCRHLWEHYVYGLDTQFLERRAYPVMKAAAEFMLGWLVPDHQGRLVTAPSVSPETHFIVEGRRCGVSVASTMDMAIIWDLFTNCIEAAKILNIDESFRSRLMAARGRLLPYQVGKAGQLQEWSEDFVTSDPGIGHVSQLFPVYPGRQITPRSPGGFAQAASVSLEDRIRHGSGVAAWPCGWYACLWARLGEAERAHQQVLNMFRNSTTLNLWNGSVNDDLFHDELFQIDGNFGVAAGIAEMLLQSHEGYIQFLPALPPAWPEGSFKGFRARNAVDVSLMWRNSQAVSAVMRAHTDGERCLRAPEGQRVAAIRCRGKRVGMRTLECAIVSVDFKKDSHYEVTFTGRSS
ncbi:MAG TPA: glycoside hydrolase family 95 protein [Acetobacteraceae bacterium]|nr:glycoside hydrolase family 95 protein [Acetobacteraceae bacterium]